MKPQQYGVRLNRQGYDRDNPQDALEKYVLAHPEPWYRKAWETFTDTIFNACTLFIPKALSLSAGRNKQRIDQKVLLGITREAVDKFPELKIRVNSEALKEMDPEDHLRWRKNLNVIRAAQQEFIIERLSQAYPEMILTDTPTILYTGGRATGLLRVLYCSVDEYVALYWSDWDLVSTDSGSYKAHVYDYILEGQNTNWDAQYLNYKENGFEITEPGEYTFLGKGDRKIWSFNGPCAMIDHGIGDVISMAKFATVSNLTSTLNGTQTARLLGTQAAAVAREYARRLGKTLGTHTVEVKHAQKTEPQRLEKARAFFAPILNEAQKDSKFVL